jgi:hypothetical protein
VPVVVIDVFGQDGTQVQFSAVSSSPVWPLTRKLPSSPVGETLAMKSAVLAGLSLATVMGPWLSARGPGGDSRADVRERVLGEIAEEAPGRRKL